MAKNQKKTAPVQEGATKSKKKSSLRHDRAVDINRPLHQAMPVILLALAAFLGICIYTAAPVGAVGGFFHHGFFGLFGNAAYFLPPLLILGAIRWRRDAAKHAVLAKTLFSFISLLLIAVLFYTFGMADADKGNLSAFYALGMQKVGGGVIGGAVGFGLHYAVSSVGTVILAIVVLVLFAIFFFDFSPYKLFCAVSRRLKQYLKARAVIRRQKALMRAKAREAQKEEAAKAAETAFYGNDSSLPVPQKDGKPFGSARSSVFPDDDGQPLARHVYNVEADATAPLTPQESPEVKARRMQALRDDFAFDEGLFTVEETPDTPVVPVTPNDQPDTSAAAPFAFDEEERLPRIEVIGNDPIPENPTAPEQKAPFGVSDVGEESEEEAEKVGDPFADIPATPVQDTEDDDLFAPVAEEPTPPAASKSGDGELLIRKAHVIEHATVEAPTASSADAARPYVFPPLSLLHPDDPVNPEDSDQEIKEKAAKLIQTLESFGVRARISCVSRGPRLTRYELVPEAGVRIRSIENLVNEIAMNLEAVSVRIEAPIPGKSAIGVEVPNVKYSTVRLRSLLDTDTFRTAPGKTTVCLGVDVVGVPVFADVDKMPHLLVAGATGMGKSVCINSILVSLLYKARPDEVKLILIDPKKVEFKSYSDIPHLLVPVVTDAQKAAGSLTWAVNEMERRYDLIEAAGVRNLKAYNKSLENFPERERLPQIIIVIDELHDLMMQAPDAVEDAICRIAQKARAAGILLIIGTQRPSVNVITGVIKANIPSRIAFHVAAQVDSRTILDVVGAEKLLNNGDMLFLCPGMQMLSPKRVQGAFLDDDEVTRVAEFLRKESGRAVYDEAIQAEMERESEKCSKDKKGAMDMPMSEGGDSEDDLFYRAIEVALDNGKISTSLLQRKLSLGFGKAARMIDRMEDMGIVSPPNGQKPREVLITMDDYRAMRLRNDE